ncbi:DUF6191 domain-containing protein [Streptomyces qinzhouensis]|uniref:Uncharacterized protein n=1 Tax=Streptomyces qinzhouensis TaxID=2599401 RepID=A0A5B8JBG9_9ACTN|nr:DUF6191 domain-containing protein [Streptomyces qinzhouensis]QDY79165.1 hypothetical protein FQU76_24550 [Streptomyces qinzhouensis]
MLNILDQIFAPGRKHTQDEQNRLELTRVDVGASDPARGPIDLVSGRVTVRRPGTPPDGRTPAESTPRPRNTPPGSTVGS